MASAHRPERAIRCLLAVLSLLTSGCDREAPKRPAVADEEPTPQAVFSVTERGAPPHRQLRIGSKVGATGTFRVFAREMHHDDDLHDRMLEAWFAIEVTILDPAPDGSSRLAFKVVATQAPDGEALYEEESLLRAHGETRVDRRGASKPVDWRLHYHKGWAVELLDKALRQTQDEIPALLPEEPIGAGARWTVTRPIRRVPGRLSHGGTQKVEYTLTGIVGNRLSIRADLVEEAAEQPILDLSSAAAGEVARLLSMRADGSATLNIDLDRIPLASGMTTVWSDHRMYWGRRFAGWEDGEIIASQTGLSVVVEPAD